MDSLIDMIMGTSQTWDMMCQLRLFVIMFSLETAVTMISALVGVHR